MKKKSGEGDGWIERRWDHEHESYDRHALFLLDPISRRECISGVEGKEHGNNEEMVDRQWT